MPNKRKQQQQTKTKTKTKTKKRIISVLDNVIPVSAATSKKPINHKPSAARRPVVRLRGGYNSLPMTLSLSSSPPAAAKFNQQPQPTNAAAFAPYGASLNDYNGPWAAHPHVVPPHHPAFAQNYPSPAFAPNTNYPYNNPYAAGSPAISPFLPSPSSSVGTLARPLLAVDPRDFHKPPPVIWSPSSGSGATNGDYAASSNDDSSNRMGVLPSRFAQSRTELTQLRGLSPRSLEEIQKKRDLDDTIVKKLSSNPAYVSSTNFMKDSLLYRDIATRTIEEYNRIVLDLQETMEEVLALRKIAKEKESEKLARDRRVQALQNEYNARMQGDNKLNRLRVANRLLEDPQFMYLQTNGGLTSADNLARYLVTDYIPVMSEKSTLSSISKTDDNQKRTIRAILDMKRNINDSQVMHDYLQYMKSTAENLGTEWFVFLADAIYYLEKKTDQEVDKILTPTSNNNPGGGGVPSGGPSNAPSQ